MALPDSQGNYLYVPHSVDIPSIFVWSSLCDIPGISFDIYERNTWFGTPGPQQIMIIGQSAMEQSQNHKPYIHTKLQTLDLFSPYQCNKKK